MYKLLRKLKKTKERIIIKINFVIISEGKE